MELVYIGNQNGSMTLKHVYISNHSYYTVLQHLYTVYVPFQSTSIIAVLV